MYKIGIDPGHGGSDSGACGMGYREKDLTLQVGLKLKTLLENSGFAVTMSRTNDSNTYDAVGPELSHRAYVFNNAAVDAVLSIHLNSAATPASGFETYTWSGNDAGYAFGESIHNAVLSKKLYNINRGHKRADFAILRETDAPAALVEMAFINSNDINTVIGHIDEWAQALYQGIAAYFNVSAKPTATLQAKPKNQPPKDILYDMPIMGNQYLTAEAMARYCLKHNNEPKINCSIQELATYFLEEGKKEGVRGDIAFCQALKETGYFKFGGQVLPEQNNYSGLGATNNSAVGKGAWFSSPQEGVRAQIQHLKGYATTDPIQGDVVDPRYDILKTSGLSGKHTTWKSLSGFWAYPGYDAGKYNNLAEAIHANDDYGSSILKIYIDIKKEQGTQTQPAQLPTSVHWAVDHKLIIGDGQGNLMIKEPLTLERFIEILYRYDKLTKPS